MSKTKKSKKLTKRLKRHVVKSDREYETIQTDRVELATEANSVILAMVTKEALSNFGSVPSNVEFTDQESRTYNAALNYLERQFEKGSLDTETILKRVVDDEDTEFKER